MEVCGGHTHAIAKHGLEDLLPAGGRVPARPGLPGLRDPDGTRRRRDRPGRAAEVMLATFGDLLRVPGRRGTLLEAKARGADVRMVYSPLDALAIARAEPEREVVFFAIGFETTAPATAVTLLRARDAGRAQLLGLLQPRDDRAAAPRDPRHTGYADRRFHRAGPRLDGDRHRAVRVHPGGVRQAGRRRGLRAARHPRLDGDDPAPARRGPLRGREPVHAGRPAGGEPTGARGDRRDDGAPRDLRVARTGLDPPKRAPAATRLRPVGRRVPV